MMADDIRTDIPFDARPSIRLANTIMEHPKIADLSDAAFRAFVEAICFCSRQETDGKIKRGAIGRIGKPKVIAELVAAGLLEICGTDYWVHDYLRHQRASSEIQAFRESKSEGGKLGAHKRWHVPRRQVVKDCEYCLKGVSSA